MSLHTGMLAVQTRGNAHIVDITAGVKRIVTAAGVADALISLFVTGSTAALTTMEYERGGVADLQALLDRLIPATGDYQHNILNADDNAHSHLRASLIGPSLTIPLVGGRLGVGVWQQVVLIELDDRPRDRAVTVQVLW